VSGHSKEPDACPGRTQPGSASEAARGKEKILAAVGHRGLDELGDALVHNKTNSRLEIGLELDIHGGLELVEDLGTMGQNGDEDALRLQEEMNTPWQTNDPSRHRGCPSP
jgi:hypothetical protein